MRPSDPESRPPRPPAVLVADGLSAAMERMRLRAWVAGVSEFRGPFGLRVPTYGGGFHALLEGNLVILTGESAEPVLLQPGDVAVLGPGDWHSLQDRADRPLRPIAEFVNEGMAQRHEGLRLGDRGPTTRIINGAFNFAEHAPNAARLGLPPVIVLRHGEAVSRSAVWPAVIPLLQSLVADLSPGTHAMMNHLASVLFVEAVRTFLGGDDVRAGSLAAAILDDHIGPALSLIHTSPQREWTSQQLADEAGLSRTVFHERFMSMIGLAPHQYLTAYRMRIAADLCRHTEHDLTEIGRRTGYASQGALCNAFKRFHGVPPGEYRRASRRCGVAEGRVEVQIHEAKPANADRL
jgi:AraC-like DNA-binding protein